MRRVLVLDMLEFISLAKLLFLTRVSVCLFSFWWDSLSDTNGPCGMLLILKEYLVA